MDMREASAMTEASGLVNDEDGVKYISSARPSASGLRPRSSDAAARWTDQLRNVTTRAPLQSLFVAFMLGFWAARRR